MEDMETPAPTANHLRVGLVGIGRMGAPLAMHIMARGFTTSYYDVSADAMRSLRETDAYAALDPADVAAHSDVILLVVGYPEQAEEAMLGERGILAGSKPGSIIVLSTTLTPMQAQRFAAASSDAGVGFLDAPICRGEQGAIDADSLWLVGGDPHTLKIARPVMEACGSDIYHIGEVPAGQVAKSINNLLLWAALCANQEGFEICRAYGLDETVLRVALSNSTAANWSLCNWDEMQRIPWAMKDMAITMELIDEARLVLPMAGLVREEVKRHYWDAGYI